MCTYKIIKKIIGSQLDLFSQFNFRCQSSQFFISALSAALFVSMSCNVVNNQEQQVTAADFVPVRFVYILHIYTLLL